MKCPAEVYQPSPRPYQGLPDIDYPFHDKTIVVTRCGRICLGNKKINFSQVFAGQAVGIKEVHDDIWLVSFMDYDLGYFDLETRVLEPLENPFGPKVLPMYPVHSVTHVSGLDPEKLVRGVDLNHRPLGYEPNELPDCSTPHSNHNNVVAERSNVRCGLDSTFFWTSPSSNEFADT